MTRQALASLIGKRFHTAAFAILAAGTGVAQAQDAEFKKFPFVVFCEFNGVTNAYYFSQLQNGQAIYLSPDRQIGVVTLGGDTSNVGEDRQGNCADKTVDDLRAAGQAFDLPAAPAQ